MESEQGNLTAHLDAAVIRNSGHAEQADAQGKYEVICLDADGNEKWRDIIDNIVTTVGKNAALDAFLAGSSYTVTGPFIGLITSTGWSSVAAGDTMASHGGWVEGGGATAPTYTSPRKVATWSAASAGTKALSAAQAFGMSGAGTVKGCFMVYGAGATSTIDNTGGTLLSAGTFSGGDKVVASGDTLNVSYSLSL